MTNAFSIRDKFVTYVNYAPARRPVAAATDCPAGGPPPIRRSRDRPTIRKAVVEPTGRQRSNAAATGRRAATA